MIVNFQHMVNLLSTSRTIAGSVELYKGSTLSQTFLHTDALSKFTVSRASAKKFFGYGVSQELEMVLIDRERKINIAENDVLRVAFTFNDNKAYAYTPFEVYTDIQRNETTNEITVKAYDAIYKAKNYTVADLKLVAPYSIADVANAVSAKIGTKAVTWRNIDGKPQDYIYENGANFDGAETLREVLDAIAEATQSIYFISSANYLTFRRLEFNSDPNITIDKSLYFNLSSKTDCILSDICAATTLGDNVITQSEKEGKTQYVRDNPFWFGRSDIVTVLINALAALDGLSINQFDCKWRGNYLLEPGDKIALITKDDNRVISYVLNEVSTYNGGFSSQMNWEYADNEDETVDNPVSLGDRLKQTYATVNKATKEIELLASETAENTSNISNLLLTTDGIAASVSRVEELTETSIETINGNINTLTQEVSAKMSATDVNISIQTALEQGVDKITTTTGFTFNEEGLRVSKSNNEISTLITEDGMAVYKGNEKMLVADNLGVKAEDLHATTFLIIGKNSRLEDYDNSRTGCFWIGG